MVVLEIPQILAAEEKSLLPGIVSRRVPYTMDVADHLLLHTVPQVAMYCEPVFDRGHESPDLSRV